MTTLFDLYGLPGDFPGLAQHRALANTAVRCNLLEQALATRIDDRRFAPYIQRHEFEALVLASLAELGELLDAKDDLDGLAKLEADCSGTAAEDINDGVATAPSKRLVNHVPGYSKSLHGPLATSATGIAKLRQRCRRFGDWVARLEKL